MFVVMIVIALVFVFWSYVLYKNIKHNHLVWELEKAKIKERYNKEQLEIQEAFRKNEELRQTMIAVDDIRLTWYDKNKSWQFTTRFVNFTHHAHCLLHPNNCLQRKTFTERLRTFKDYKTAIYQTPTMRCTRKFWTKEGQA